MQSIVVAIFLYLDRTTSWIKGHGDDLNETSKVHQLKSITSFFTKFDNPRQQYKLHMSPIDIGILVLHMSVP